MINKEIGRHKYKKLINNSNKFIYDDRKNGKMIKLDKDCALQMRERNMVSIGTSRIDPVQISELASKQEYVEKSSLPEGIIYYGFLPVGVIYPRYFYNYKNFDELYNENVTLIINNLKKAYYNNLELIHNDICNKDLSFKNIMYNNNDVQLVDLDGNLIGKKYNSTYNQIYQDFIFDLYVLLRRKLNMLYGDDSSKAYEEIRYLFECIPLEMKEDYPLQIIEKIEKTRILK